QPDGKIVSTNGFSVIRYSAEDGTLDRTFGGGRGGNAGQGDTRLIFGAQGVLPADGKIRVAGSTAPRRTQGYDPALVRYNPDGSLDTTYGTGGTVIQHFASPIETQEYIHAAIDPGTGKIVALVDLDDTHETRALVRFNTNGSLDTSFAGAGYETLRYT